MNEIQVLKEDIEHPINQPNIEEKTMEISGTLEEAVAEEWTLGSNQFASGNYSKCFKHHTIAVQLLLDAYEERKLLVEKLKVELFKIQKERNFLETKCSAVSDALAALENNVSYNEKHVPSSQVNLKPTETELKDILEVTNKVINDFDSLEARKKIFEASIQRKNTEINNLKSEKILLSEEIEQLRKILQEYKADADSHTNSLVKQIKGYETHLQKIKNENEKLNILIHDNSSLKDSEMQSSILKLEKEKRMLLTENTRLKSESEEFNDLKDEKRALEDEKNSLYKKIVVLERELKKEIEEKENILDSATALENENTSLQVQLSNTNVTEDSAKKEELIDLRQEILFLKEDLEQYRLKVEEYENLIARKDEEIINSSNVDKTIDNYENQLAMLKSNLKLAEAQRNEIGSELRKMNETVNAIETDEEELTKKRSAALEREKMKVADLTLSMDKLKTNTKSTENKYKTIKDQLDHVSREIQRLKSTNAKLLDKLNYKELELTGKDRETKTLSLQNKRLIDENAELAKKQPDPVVIDEFRVELSEKNLELSEYRNELKRKEQENLEVMLQLKELQKSPDILPLLQVLESSFVDCISSVEHIETRVEIIRREAGTDKEKLNKSEFTLVQARGDLQNALSSLEILKKQAAEEKNLLSQEIVAASNTGNTLRSDLALEQERSSELEINLKTERVVNQNIYTELGTLKVDLLNLESELNSFQISSNLKNEKSKVNSAQQQHKIDVLCDLITEAQDLLESTEYDISSFISKKLIEQENDQTNAYQSLKKEKLEVTEKYFSLNSEFSELKKEHLLSNTKCEELDRKIIELKLENKKILRDASEFYNIDVGNKDTSELDSDILERLRASMDILDETILHTADLGEENQKLKEEVTGLRNCYLLEKAMQDQSSNSDISSTDYLDESSYLDEEEVHDDLSLDDINDVDTLKQQIELERAQTRENLSAHHTLKEKYEELFKKFQTVAKGTLINDSVSLPQSSLPISHSLIVENTVDDLMKSKEKQVGELMELLQQNQVDINLLTQELSKLYYKYQKKDSKGSPTKNFLSILRNKVAPNVLVILIAFFTALKQKSLEASIS